MTKTTDINNLDDIKLLVNTFYAKVQQNPLIGSIFNNVIQDRWPEHLEKMYRFWQTVLLGDHTYFGSPFPPHAFLPIQQEHFDKWLFLWRETIDEFFEGKIAEEAKWRSTKMAAMFLSKIEYYKNSSSNPLI